MERLLGQELVRFSPYIGSMHSPERIRKEFLMAYDNEIERQQDPLQTPEVDWEIDWEPEAEPEEVPQAHPAVERLQRWFESLVDTFSGNDIPNLLQVLANPETQEQGGRALNQILADAESWVDGNFAPSVGSRALELLASNRGADRHNGERLLDLVQGTTGEQALGRVLASMENAQLTQVIQYMDNQANAAQMGQLRTLLSSDDEAQRDIGNSIINQLASPHESVRSDGNSLATMLTQPEHAGLARSLATMFDVEQRRQLLQIFNNPQTRDATEMLLSALQSSNRQERRSAADLLESFASPVASEQANAARMVQMLANPEQRHFAATILRSLPEELRPAAIAMRADAATRPAADQLERWLNGTPAQRGDAARFLSEYTSAASASRQEVLRNMLVNPERREQLQTALRTLSTPGQASLLASYLDSNVPQERQLGNQVMQMLQSQNQLDQQNAGMLLSNLGEPLTAREMREGYSRPNAQAAARRLLTMLSNPEHRAMANTIMNRLDSFGQMQAMMDVLFNPATHASGQTMLGMLENPNNRALAGRILDAQIPPESLARVIERTTDQANQAATRQLLSMPQAESARLMRMMGGTPSEQAIATSLYDTLNNPNRAWEARTAISNSTTPAEAQTLLNLSTNREMRTAVQRLNGLIDSEDTSAQLAGRTLLSMLSSPAQRDSGNTLLRMLNSPQDAQVAQSILQQGSAPAANALLSAMNDQARPRAAAEIRRLLNDGERSEQAVANLTQALLNPALASHREGLLGMLNSAAGSNELQFALTALNADGPNQFGVLMGLRQSNPAAARQLGDMLGSNNSTQRAAASNLLAALIPTRNKNDETIAPPPAYTRELVRLLGSNDPAESNRARSIMQAARGTADMENMVRVVQQQGPRAEQVRTMLAGDAASQVSARNLAALNAADAEAFRRLSENADTRERAQRALSSATTPEQLSTLTQMLSNPQFAASASTLLQMPAADRSALLDRLQNPQLAHSLVSLMTTPATAEAGQSLLRLLNDDENPGNSTAAFRILDLLGGPRAAEGRRLVQMMSDDRDYETALDIARSSVPQEYLATLLDTLAGSGYTARSELEQMLRDNNTAIIPLMEMLASRVPAQRAEGRRLLGLMDSYFHAPTGIRVLARTAPDFSANK